jgi:hypothetical protein
VIGTTSLFAFLLPWALAVAAGIVTSAAVSATISDQPMKLLCISVLLFVSVIA